MKIFFADTQTKGRGVFAKEKILKDEIIEEAPVIVIDADQCEHIEKTNLSNYYFDWGQNDEQGAIVVGLCQLCNHSYLPNAQYFQDLNNTTFKFIALRDIEPGEEVCVNYNFDPECKDPVWFKVEDK